MRTNGSYHEWEMLLWLKNYVKEVLKLNVPNPDYRQSRIYSPQWKVLGALYYYQLPESLNGRIIATFDSHTGDANFDSYGVKL